MTRLTILEYPDPRLRTVAQPVEVVDNALRALIDDMFETMYASNGVGLAATQVNVHRRLLVADVSEDRDQPLALAHYHLFHLHLPRWPPRSTLNR